jgi:hypothetical protein
MIEVLMEKLAELKRLSERQHELNTGISELLSRGSYRVELRHVILSDVELPDMEGDVMYGVLNILLFLAGKEVPTRRCGVELTEREVVFKESDRIFSSIYLTYLTLYRVLILLVLEKYGALGGAVGDILRFAEEEIRYVLDKGSC